MKIKHLILYSIVLLSLNCFSQENSFKITGTVKNEYQGHIYLRYGEKTDSSLVENQKFSFEGVVDFPILSRLYTKNSFLNEALFLENSEMEIEITITDPIIIINSISGNKTAELMSDLREYFIKLQQDPEIASKLYNKLDSIFTENPRNQFSSMLLEDIAMDRILTYEQVYALYQKIDKTVQNKEVIESINNSLDNLKNIIIGTEFKPLKLPDTEGKLISSSKFKDKVLLVYFWASWCGACMQNNSQTLEIYRNYRDYGFEIFAVSLDVNKKSWEQAIKNDSLKWVNTFAEGGLHNQAVKSLGIQFIPSNYLIDTNGIIRGINLRPGQLEEKLSELLKE